VTGGLSSALVGRVEKVCEQRAGDQDYGIEMRSVCVGCNGRLAGTQWEGPAWTATLRGLMRRPCLHGGVSQGDERG